MPIDDLPAPTGVSDLPPPPAQTSIKPVESEGGAAFGVYPDWQDTHQMLNRLHSLRVL